MKLTKKFLLKMLILFLIAILTACASNASLSKDNNVASVTTDETRIEGELIRIDGDEMVIQQSDGMEVLLHTTESTIFWEGIDWLEELPAEMGDQITAWGEWNKDQSAFEVESYYANMQEIHGVVFYVCGETEAFMLDQPDQDYLILPMLKRTQLLTESPEDPRSYKYYDLMPNFGEKLTVVGRSIEEPFVIAVKMTRMD
ncbi:MAG: hypothetical protein K0B14_01225 [Anaerolineaceae bacterium]|nr:hypothetical protein [Anaerolineaceae bacterium]